MIKVKDGYAKLVGTTYLGSANHLLRSNGGVWEVHTGRNNEANKIVRTDGSGYLQTGWISTTSGDMGTTSINRVYCSNDSYIRYKTPANFFSSLTNSGDNLSITIASQNRTLTVLYARIADLLRSKGTIAPQTGRTLNLGDVYSYHLNASVSGGPTTYAAVIGFGRGTSGTVEIAGEWTGGRGLWVRALRNTTDNWYAWDKVLTQATYTGITDSRYYTKTLADERFVNVTGDTMTGYLTINTNGAYVKFGCQNGSHAHYETSATVSHYFNKTIDVNGVIRVYNTGTYMNATGFYRNGSSNSYTLLGGGGQLAYSTGPDASTLVLRTSSGYIFGTYFNSAIGDESPTIGSVFIRNTSDNYIRRTSYSNFISNIGTSLDSRYVNITGDTMTGPLTINPSGEVRKIVTEFPSYASGKPVQLLSFYWYTDKWSIGNIRSGSTPSNGLGFYYNNTEKVKFTNGGTVNCSGFIKLGSSDSYVILGGGGHKAISDFAVKNHNHNSLYITALGTSGNYVTWTKNGTTNNLTVPYAERARQLSSYGQSPNNSHPGYGARIFYSWNIGQANNATAGYSNGITIGSNPGDTAYGFLIVQNMWDDRTYTRRYNSGWLSWKTLAWTSDILNPADYYWANIRISASSSTGTSPTFSTAYTSNWFRSTGNSGWYSETYGGGWNMTDTTYIRAYGSKRVYTANTSLYAFYTSGGMTAVKGFWHSAVNSNSYVLLAGGSYKAVSDFATSGHTHSYLPLSGGTVTGITNFTNRIRIVGTAATPAWNSVGITFTENTTDAQAVSFIYTSYDTYRAPAGIKLIGNQGNEWFEAPKIYATTFYGSLSGNASSATKLATACTLWGQSFNGKANVSGNMTGVGHIYTSGYLYSTRSGVNRAVIDYYGGGKPIFGFGTAGAGIDTYLDGNNIYLRTSSSHIDTMTLTSSGNVLIGTTTNLSYKLDVNGTTRASGFVKNGSSDSYVLLGGGGTCFRSDVLPIKSGAVDAVNSSYVSQSSLMAYQLGHIVIIQGSFSTGTSASNRSAYFTIPSSIGAPLDETGWDSPSNVHNNGIRMRIPSSSHTIYLVWNDAGTSTAYQMSWIYYSSTVPT